MCDFSSNANSWQSVSAENLCPICKKPDNCKISADQSAVWCGRESSSRTNAGGQSLWLRDRDGSYFPAGEGPARPARAARDRTPIVRKKAQTLDQAISERLRKREGGQRAYDAASDAPDLLRFYADRLKVPFDGLQRTGARVEKSNKAYLIYPEQYKLEQGLQHAGYQRRWINDQKQMVDGSSRGCSMWGDDQVVYCVEGFTDLAVLAGCGLTAASRPNNCMGGAELAHMLWDTQMAVIIGENDKKPDGSWPGKEGVDVVAKEFCLRTERAVLKVQCPEGVKDVRQWWVAFCEANKYSPSNPTAAATKHFRETVAEHVAKHAQPHGVDGKRRQQILSERETAAEERADIALHTGDCGIWYNFKQRSDDPRQQGVKSLDFKIRCKRHNSCESCAAFKEADFVRKILRVWQVDCHIEFIYRVEIDHSELDKFTRKVREQHGGYAWFRMSPERTRIYTDVPIADARVMDASEAADCLQADAENSDRTIALENRTSIVGFKGNRHEAECDRTATRMYKSKRWRLDDEKDEEPSDLEPVGPITRQSFETAAQHMGIDLEDIETPSDRDHRELLKTGWIDEARCDELTERAMSLDAMRRAMRETTVTLRVTSQLPINNTSSLNIGKSDALAQILTNHLPRPADSPPSRKLF